MTRIILVTILAICSITITSTARAMVRGYEPDPFDVRFDPVAAFGRTIKLDGSQQEHNHFGNATLVHPWIAVTARHLLPTTDRNGNNYYSPDYIEPNPGTYTLRFRRHTDGSLGTKAAGWESFHQVRIMDFILPDNRSDVAIAILEEPVTHIDPMPAQMGGLQVDDDVIAAGWGKEGPGFNAGPRGRLLLADKTLYYADLTGLFFPSADFTAGGEEPGPNMFDSGGAILWEDADDRVHIAGVISTTSGGASLEQFKIADEFFASLLTDLDGILGDFDGNGAINGLDVPGFKAALADPSGWASAHPEGLNAHILGDFDGNGLFNGLDIPGFKAVIGSTPSVPEPATLLLVIAGAAAAFHTRRSHG